MLENEVLIFEPRAIDRLTTMPSAMGKITTLRHETWDDSVEL